MSADVGPIPPDWRKLVGAILRKGDPSKINVCRRALQDWQATFPAEFFEYSLRDALADALEAEGIMGKPYQMDEPGKTYGFMFKHKTVQLYAKINLTDPDNILIVYSAHRPLCGDELI